MSALDPEGLEKAAEALFEREFSFDWHAENLKDTMSVESQFVREAQAAVEAYLGHTEVTTVAELDALPERSIVECAKGHPYWLHRRSVQGFWYRPGDEDAYAEDEIPLPATVLHQPTP